MPKVLVVDDLSSDRLLIKAELEVDPHLTIDFAENGSEALVKMTEAAPDLVITDLHMPKMDGLDLVRRIRRDFPHVPIILVTAFGSEHTAVEALRQGAASYVPKSHLEDRLLETVNELLALARCDRLDARLGGCLDGAEFRFLLPNDPEMIPPLVDLLQNFVQRVQLCDANDRVRLGVALEEALLNALYHGNLEITAEELEQAKSSLLQQQSLPLADQRRSQAPYRDRQITVRARICADEARFVIEDQGPGFDVAALREPIAPGSFDQSSGRGILLMQSFMDSVTFSESGNAVTMVKRRDRPGGNAGLDMMEQRASAIFSVDVDGKTLVLTPRRNVTSFAEAELQNEMGELFSKLRGNGARHVVIDFGHIVYFGSCMLEAMRILVQHVRRLEGRVAVCNLSPVAYDILKIARFDHVWSVHDSRTEAVKAVSRP